MYGRRCRRELKSKAWFWSDRILGCRVIATWALQASELCILSSSSFDGLHFVCRGKFHLVASEVASLAVVTRHWQLHSADSDSWNSAAAEKSEALPLLMNPRRIYWRAMPIAFREHNPPLAIGPLRLPHAWFRGISR